MRDTLIPNLGVRQPFQAVFHYTAKMASDGRGAALLTDLRDPDGAFLAEHVWVGGLRPKVAARLRQGDRLSFSAVPALYFARKGKAFVRDGVVHFGPCHDVGLEKPGRVSVGGNVLDENPRWFQEYPDRLIRDFNVYAESADDAESPFSRVGKCGCLVPLPRIVGPMNYHASERC